LTHPEILQGTCKCCNGHTCVNKGSCRASTKKLQTAVAARDEGECTCLFLLPFCILIPDLFDKLIHLHTADRAAHPTAVVVRLSFSRHEAAQGKVNQQL
jgi:hypothetical protein